MKKFTIKAFLIEFITHLVIFFSLCILYVIMLTYPDAFDFSNFLSLKELWPTIVYGLTYCILFYHFFFSKLLLHTRLKILLVTLTLLIAGFYTCDILFQNYLNRIRHYNKVDFFEITTLFRLAIFTVYAILYSSVRGLAWLRIQRFKIEEEAAKASLHNLRSQIEPHFIFNTLNNVYALSIEEKAGKTSESIEELSSLFRYSLKDSRVEKISIQDELDFIEKYIHLHKIRVQQNDKTKIETSIFWDKKPSQIAPMLLITFIENAFKYGLSFKRKSFIEIKISVKDRKLHLLVKNSINEDTNIAQNGLGLENTRKRLDLLYRSNYTLDEVHEKFIHEVILNINLI